MQMGKHVNEKDIFGNTPLHIVSFMTNFITIEYKGMDHHIFTTETQQNMMEILLKLGANPEITNNSNLTPFDVIPDKICSTPKKLLFSAKWCKNSSDTYKKLIKLFPYVYNTYYK